VQSERPGPATVDQSVPVVSAPTDEEDAENPEVQNAVSAEESQPFPRSDQSEISEDNPVVDQNSLSPWLIMLGGVVLVGIAGTFYWLRKRSTAGDRPAEAAVAEDALKTETVEPDPVPSPKRKAPAKIYSPPDPTADLKPAPASNNGFVTTKIGVPPKAQPAEANRGIAANKPTSSPSTSAEVTENQDLLVEFYAEKVSSTLLNAVIGFRLKLTNTCETTLTNIKIFGDLIQADQHAAMLPAMQRNNMIDQVDSLPPGNIVEIPGEIKLPLTSIKPISYNDQALFIPLARLEFDLENSVGEVSQQSASFIVGQEHQPPREKMAPFRLDLGPRNFEPVGQRPVQI